MLCLLLTVNIFAGEGFNKAGRTSLQFLKIGIGARQAALGEACIANVHDVSAVFWNPAGIIGIPHAEAAFNYTKWFGDMDFTSGAIGFRLGDYGVGAISYISLNYGQLQEALVTSPTGHMDTRTGDTFSGKDLAIGISYARSLTSNFSIGVSIKYIQEDLFTYTSSLWGFDIGTLYDTGWKGIRLAMSAQNFASQARWLHTGAEERQSYEIPLLYRIGWSIDLLGAEDLFLGGRKEHQRLTFNMDAIHTNDYAERLHLGMEYWLFDLFTIRSGYRFNYEEGNLSFGGGLKYQIRSITLKIDYAYVNYDFLNSPHRFSLCVTF